MTDELMDTRLTAAGAQWRAQHATTGPVSVAAVIEAVNEPDEPAAGSGRRVVGGRRPRAWIAGAIAVAAMAAALVIGLVHIGGDRSRPAPPADPSKLYDVTWRNASFDFNWLRVMHRLPSPGRPPYHGSQPTMLRFRRNGTVVGSNGCNDFRARVNISGNHLTFSDVMRTPGSCAGPQARTSAYELDTLLTGTLRWSIPCGELHLTNPVRGVVEYRPAHFPESQVRCLMRWSRAHSGH